MGIKIYSPASAGTDKTIWCSYTSFSDLINNICKLIDNDLYNAYIHHNNDDFNSIIYKKHFDEKYDNVLIFLCTVGSGEAIQSEVCKDVYDLMNANESDDLLYNHFKDLLLDCYEKNSILLWSDGVNF